MYSYKRLPTTRKRVVQRLGARRAGAMQSTMLPKLTKQRGALANNLVRAAQPNRVSVEQEDKIR